MSKLSDICEYVREKVDVLGLTNENYISTENMLPEKGGVIPATSLPTTDKVQKYSKGDVLVSNIRPYFKKIWQARNNGGCSNDVLVFKAKDNCYSVFLYYVLANDDFFKYATATSNGTKMPRGDKSSIMQYGVPYLDLETQKKIARVLGALDDKIELNNQINHNLEEQARALFKSWFVDFEPFGGTMPSEWKMTQLGEVSKILAGGDKPLIVSNKLTKQCHIPIYSNGIDNAGLYGYTNKARIYKESVTVSARGTIGFTCLRLKPYVPIVRLISLEPIENIVSAKYLYFSLLNKDISGTGTTQQQLTVPYFKTTKVLVPEFKVMDKFTKVVDSFYKIIDKNKTENEYLAQLRDSLLPKLMLGEIDVSEVKV